MSYNTFSKWFHQSKSYKCSVMLLLLVFLSGSTLLKAEISANKLIINADQGKEKINRHIYGHFAEHLGRCIYEGIWVGEDSPIPNTRGIRNDIVEALRNINIPNLRWPGGCFADTYHWMDGIGPKDQRPTIVNIHWGGVTENNHFGTHEFLDFCEQLGTEPLICGNVGSGSVQELAQWVEYVNFDGKSPMADLRRKNGRDKPWKVKFWGIGNENWGCGGNMSPEKYADEYKQFSTFVRNYGGTEVYKIACGPSGENYDWTEVLMSEAGGGWRPSMNGLDLHYYTNVRRPSRRSRGRFIFVDRSGPQLSRSATEFAEDEWFATLYQALRIDEIITDHSTIMDRHDPEKRISLCVGEWGTWYDVEPETNPGFLYQQNSLRDALVAGVSLNIYNGHCDRVHMANIAQTINVLQAMVLTKNEKMILTPTYHVFEMYKVHQDATLLPIDLLCKDYTFGENKLAALNVSASKDESGKIHVTICNLDPNNAQKLDCDIRGIKISRVAGRVLTAPKINSHNTFDEPDAVKTEDFKDVQIKNGMIMATLPAKSIVLLEVE